MKSKIAICTICAAISVLSVSLAGCSESSGKSTSKITTNTMRETSESSSSDLSNWESSDDITENSPNKSEASSGDNTLEGVKPVGTPTIFIGPDEKPIYDTEVTKITSYDSDFSKTAAEITVEDEGVTIFCEGFQYFKEPEGTAYSTYENPEMFDGAEFKNPLPKNENEWKRINVGDKICGLTLKSATSTFENYNKDNFDYYQTYYTQSVPDFPQFAEFSGSVTLTGYLNSSRRTSYEPNGGELRLTPTENKLPIMPNGMMYKINPETYMTAMSYDGGEMYAVNEVGLIGLGNPLELDLGCIGIGDTAYVRVTISNINYLAGQAITAELVDIEVLSDVLVHEEDLI